MDSVQNAAYVGAIIQVRNREDLATLNAAIEPSKKKIDINSDRFKKPYYPGGINQLNADINDLFYKEFFGDLTGEFNAKIEFIVKTDGQISHVLTTGENMSFNNQASIALYLLPLKFEPATYQGKAVEYPYYLPIKFTLEE